MSADKPMTIYKLIDPRDGRARYIGATVQTLGARLGGHIRDARRGKHWPVCSWVRELDAQGLRPTIELVEETLLPSRERYWIESLSKSGYDLLNSYDGGPIKKQLSPETCAKVSAFQKGRTKSAEHRAAIGAAHKGMTRSEQARANMSEGWRRRRLRLQDQGSVSEKSSE